MTEEADAYDRTKAPADPNPFRRWVTQLASCGQYTWFCEDDETGEAMLRVQRCRSRLCPLCGRRRADELRDKLLPAVHRMDSPRFITLTLQSSDAPLRDQIRRLYKSFAELRRSKLWSTTQRGGFATVEVTYSTKRRQWHPHLHIVADGEYCDARLLSQKWREITGDSYIVDIRKPPGVRRIVQYVTDYVTKTQDASKVPDSRLGEWAESIKSLRFVTTFGTLHGVKLEPDDPLPRPRLDPICPADPVLTAADDGDTDARHLIREICKRPQDRLPDGPDAPSPGTEPGGGRLAREIRAWWNRQQGARDHGPQGTDIDPLPGVGAGDRTERLWKESERPPPSALVR